ncbi:MAG: macro domain-containing protein [Syntrophomonas sp.]|nr:macro domain-containing protein [Syntrophomonas sp.]
MPFEIIRNDITQMRVDAIVNAANTALKMGGGVCGAIFKAAGADKLQAACNIIGPIKTGEAVITGGFELPAKYIIHTAGPVYKDGKRGEAELLRSCYIKSLMLAQKKECESIAFPLISSGIYGYPKAEALAIAATSIVSFLLNSDMNVYLVVFDKAAVRVSEKLLGEISMYIDEYYVDKHADKNRRRQLLDVERLQLEEVTQSFELYSSSAGLDALIGHLDEPFSETLLRMIDAKGKTDVEVYKRANIDRKLFSKIRSNKAYMPSKKTAVALAVALELDLDETEDLLERAGFALSHSRKFDVIIEYFITNGIYDIFEINKVLFHYDQPLLGGC